MSMINKVIALVACCNVLGEVHAWSGEDVTDLHNEYYNIFKHGNRNAASHLWSKFLLDRSSEMKHETLTYMFSGFCAVSGSPITPQDGKRYRLTLDKVSGGRQTGYMYHCCSPCVCDTQDFIKVDTKTITTLGGHVQQYNFAVIGNPCDHPEELSKPYADAFGRGMTTLSAQAPEVRCDESGKLEGAYVSDGGYIIISMFFDEESSLSSMDETLFEKFCTDRAQAGFNSGMGKIFRKVAAISPVVVGIKQDNTHDAGIVVAASSASSNVTLVAQNKTHNTAGSNSSWKVDPALPEELDAQNEKVDPASPEDLDAQNSTVGISSSCAMIKVDRVLSVLCFIGLVFALEFGFFF